MFGFGGSDVQSGDVARQDWLRTQAPNTGNIMLRKITMVEENAEFGVSPLATVVEIADYNWLKVDGTIPKYSHPLH